MEQANTSLKKTNEIPITGAQSGFSLLELSVVFVVIGLLTGGVMAGSSLLDAAKIRRIIDDVQKYKQAIAQFKEKYEEYPGDMTRATEVWGIAGGTGNDSTCYLTDSTTLADPKRTCNGNGDGQMDVPIPGAPGLWTLSWYAAERPRAWQHLSNAELIPGRFSGIWNFDLQDGNRPVSVDGTKYVVGALSNQVNAAHDNFFAETETFNMMQASLTSQYPSGTMYKIDLKMDDGKPGSGNVFGPKGSSTWQPGCTTTDSRVTSRYNTTASGGEPCNAQYYKVP
ncbi:MAG: type II secretion system GspH family protein [Rickettsiales bacterium]|nr:type II secretion system GspH family protein [Rickettsiales bacterium]